MVNERGSLTRRRVESFYRSNEQPIRLSYIHTVRSPFISPRFDHYSDNHDVLKTDRGRGI